MNFTSAKAKLDAHNQSHVLAWFDQLSSIEQQRLLTQIDQLDLVWLDRVWRQTPDAQHADPHRATIRPYVDAIQPGSTQKGSFSDAQALRVGEAALRAGQVAALLVAGGQGSRLGFEGPKGMFAIGAVSGKTLFEIHAQRLVALGRRYGVVPLLLLMCSPDNYEATATYWREQRNFGLPAERVLIFVQGVAPAVDETGRLLMENKSSLVLAANGNGGLFLSLREAGAFELMQSLGADTISYYQVDNPLSLSCDPLFVGYHKLRASEFSAKAIIKNGPDEKVGNYVDIGGKLAIVEYTEIPAQLAAQRDATGNLIFRYGNPGLFLWGADFCKRQANRTDLPFHKAHKKIAHLDQQGQLQQPQSPNGYKFESFAMDTLPDAAATLLLECDRAAEFAPVKNASGTDSPASARAQMSALYRNWLALAGVSVPAPLDVEISPLYALDAAAVQTRVKDHPIPHIAGALYLS